ncbi:hypothetical protein SAMN04487770_1513 [Butyrivibrio sp. ob235]|uniref:hypothetical protein n=1 Tax=Butyrivibrio sp. ob235 TaxID=1761780 RepID=UPI0008BC5A81|nr:hypothetical protein [Butyrivibrio sp. ob235]SEM59938.1 hypothetical protein SAMN04487770_1513 [Butyrivibrio sp. ob235]
MTRISMKRYFCYFSVLLVLLMAFFLCRFNLFVKAASTSNINPQNAVNISVSGSNETGSATLGTEYWYSFQAPTGNVWVIARLTGSQTAGVMQIDILDEQLNVIKSSYTHTGNHIAEIVCRMEFQGVGSKDTYMPKLLEEKNYYIRISGTGTYTLNLNSYADDFYGDFDMATPLTAGATQTVGMLERDDDIDSFYFEVPNNMSYKVTIVATKKMDTRIADDNDYTIDSNSLRVLRDNGTAEYTMSGYQIRRYFFLSGKGGTQYKISVDINNDDSQLGLWTSVSTSTGSRYITVNTLKGAKISIIVKKGSKNKKIKIRYKKKKKTKISLTQKKETQTYTLTRNLRPGDVVIVTATKKRYKEFNYKKKCK